MKKIAVLVSTLALAGIGSLGAAAPASAATPQAAPEKSYPVLCIDQKIPVDPQPYEICTYYPL